MALLKFSEGLGASLPRQEGRGWGFSPDIFLLLFQFYTHSVVLNAISANILGSKANFFRNLRNLLNVIWIKHDRD